MFSYNEKVAFEKGYYVFENKVYNKYGRSRRITNNHKGYPSFTITVGSRKDNTRKIKHVVVHRLVAYQKYKDRLYFDGIQVRHRNGDKEDFSFDNILIGSASENMMDKPRSERHRLACNAANKRRRFNGVEIHDIRKFHKKYKSYKMTMHKYNIRSKGSLHYILNNDYEKGN